MKRRDLLQWGTAGAAMLAGLDSKAQTLPAPSLTPEQFKTEFAQALALNTELTPLRGTAADLHTANMYIEGKLPAALQGRFYRNGPALMERAGQRYQHWFAGDGMVQQFSFSGQKVSHLGRLVRTQKFRKEEAAGRFLVPGFGTHIVSHERVTGPDSMNTANTHVMEHAGQVLALWEGGSAYAMRPDSLDTVGPVVWQEGWAQMPFSAHPKVDPQGHLWNIGGGVNGFLSYHIDPQGKLVQAQSTRLPIDPRKSGGMIHDVAVTDRYLVVPIPPMVVRWDLVAQGRVGPDVMQLTANEPLRIWVASKDDITQSRMFELPREMVFHVGNAYERPVDGGVEIVLSYVGATNSEFLGGAGVDIMRGIVSSDNASALRTVRLNLVTGKVQQHTFETDEEFPRMDPRFVGRAADWLLSPARWRTAAGNNTFYFHGVQLRNLTTGALQRYDYGDDLKPEEHLIVAKPGTHKELDAWILGTAFDVKSQRTCVNVFEAQRLADGPVARAWLPYCLPLGFHGSFAPA